MTSEPTPAADDVREWHGWQVGDVSLHVGMMPGRLNPCVYVHYGSVVEPLAYFRGHRANEQAYRLLAILDRIVHARCAHNDMLSIPADITHIESARIDGEEVGQ